jgi:hypothetical protein
MQTELKRAGGKASKWYFNLTTQVLAAMLLGALAWPDGCSPKSELR